MADYLMTSAPGVGRIAEQRPVYPVAAEVDMGDPMYTEAARRIWGQPHVAKGLGDTPPLNPIAGNRNFAYNWGADAAFAGRFPVTTAPIDSITATQSHDFRQVLTGPSNIADYRTAGVPSTFWGLNQRDALIERGNQPTSVGENNFVLGARPTDAGRDMGFFSRDVYAEKQASNLAKYKQVQAKLGLPVFGTM